MTAPARSAPTQNFTLHGKQPPPPVGTIYALNLGSNDGLGATVTEYDGKSSGNAAPERTLQLSSKLYARSIAVDSANNLYVGYFDNQYGFSPSDGKPDKGNEIAIYPAGASGSQQPSGTITADTTKSSATTIFPLFMALDPAGDLVTYGATVVDGNDGNDAVLTYAPGSQGPAAPADAWAFVSPLLTYAGPTGLALDASGNFYVNGQLHTSLGPQPGVFIASATDKNNPAVSPSRTIPWDSDDAADAGSGDQRRNRRQRRAVRRNEDDAGQRQHDIVPGHCQCLLGESRAVASPTSPPIRALTLGGVFTSRSDLYSPATSACTLLPIDRALRRTALCCR